MTFTYEAPYTSNLAQVRLRISDTNSEFYAFEDEELEQILSSKSGSVLRAAAAALRIAAVNMAKRIRITKVLNLQVDGVQAAKFLQGMAKEYEDEAKSEDASFGLQVAEWAPGIFAKQQKLQNDRLRRG